VLRAKLIFTLSFSVLIGLICGFGIIYFHQANIPTAGLKIDSDPPSLVYVNDQSVGMTPFNRTFPPGEISLRLVSQSDSPLPEFRTQLPLTAKTFSYIARRFSSSGSSGLSLYFQPLAGQETSIQVISSIPDSVFVSLDGQSQGSSPLTLSPVIPGDHQLLLTSVGFKTRNLLVKVLEGYRLVVQSQLEEDSSAQEIPQASTSSASLITILSTPTGFLRVRSHPSLSATQTGKVYPGQTFPLLESSSGWLLLDLGKNASPSSGWVSSQYSRTITP
jgi:hypothetical protein